MTIQHAASLSGAKRYAQGGDDTDDCEGKAAKTDDDHGSELSSGVYIILDHYL